MGKNLLLITKTLSNGLLYGIIIQCMFLSPLMAKEVPPLKQGSNVVYTGKHKKANTLLPEVGLFDVIISGLITDGEGHPLSGAAIMEKGTTNGTIADINGKYSISVQEGSQLVYSFVGYRSQTVTVGNQNKIDIVMEQYLGDLEEVVVVGYGTQKKSNLTGSVTDIKADDLLKIPSIHVGKLLIGQVPGLISNQTPGLPGKDNVNLSIRGFGDPLVIVDGVESHMDRIDPNDIESISVLKDASAAIYGARAGNGVILVTTKRGKAESLSIDYHGYYATQKRITFADQVDAAGFIRLRRDAIFNSQFDPENPDDEINYSEPFTEKKLRQYESGELPSYNWVDEVLRKNGAPLMSHNLSLRGGGENIRHYTSIGYSKQAGPFNGDYNYRKYNFTHNFDANLSKNLQLALNFQYINEFRDYSLYDPQDIWVDLQTAQPIYNPHLPDPSRAPYSGFSERSPTAKIRQDIAGYQKTRLETLSAAAELKYSVPKVKGLELGGKLNVRVRNLEKYELKKEYDVWEYNASKVTNDFDGYTSRGSILGNYFERSIYFDEDFNDPSRRVLSRLYLQYKKEVGKHMISILAFGENENNFYKSISINRRDLLSTDIPQIEGADKLTKANGTGRDIEYSRVSFAGRLNYRYDDKYLLEATMRTDASSKFGPNVRWGFFPSVSVGWDIAKEVFLANSGLLDQLKLRLSYSLTGVDDNVSDISFDYLTGFKEKTGEVYYLDGVATPMISAAGLVNPNLTWEESNIYNAGVDLAMLDGKLYSTFDVFYRYRDGLLNFPLKSYPITFGADLPYANLDSRSNRGVELIIGNKGKIGEVNYDISVGAAYARERYENYQENIDESDEYQAKFVKLSGRWKNITYGHKSDGLFNSQNEVDQYLEQYTIEDINGSPKPGDIRYVDLNGDNVINKLDQYQIGYGDNPDITYSISPKFSYKNFSLSMLWQGATRFNVNVTSLFRAPFNTEQVPLKLHEQYSWRQDPSNPGVNINPNAQLPAFDQSGARPWNNIDSDFWTYNGTYIRLKTITLSYSLPKSIQDRLKLSRAMIYVSGDNVLSFNKMGIFKKAIDPEELTNAIAFKLPLQRTISFGVQLGF